MASPAPMKRLPLVPPLENGDHLTRDEFERRYKAMPDLKKAEMIEGVVPAVASVVLRRLLRQPPVGTRLPPASHPGYTLNRPRK